MCIDFIRRFSLAAFAFFACLFLAPALLHAVTVEVEDDEDAVVATPVPAAAKPKASEPAPVVFTPTAAHAAVKIKTVESPAAPVASKPQAAVSRAPLTDAVENRAARVRISEKIGFYYFLKAGFVTTDPSRVSNVGTVLDSGNNSSLFQTADKTYVELDSNQAEVKTGDLLMVYRSAHRVEEAHSGFSQWWIRNLAVVKVVEVEKKRCLIEVNKSFFPFKAGDRVRFYDDEIKRWKQAQVKKTLPDHPIKGYVAVADPSVQFISQSDFLVLTVGSKKGVVEGQRFQIRDDVFTGGRTSHPFQGIAQVFYAGADCSMAQIIYSNVPVRSGFEARYQP